MAPELPSAGLLARQARAMARELPCMRGETYPCWKLVGAKEAPTE